MSVIDLEKFFELLRIPSVSADPAYHGDVLRCADWLEAYLADLPMEVERLELAGNPTILASYMVSEELPTYLIYNHYDVQPPDPVDEWGSSPFEPRVEDGKVIARGASDNKGQLFYVLSAIRAYLKDKPTLGFNLKLMIEGEEEIGSPCLAELMEKYADKLACDRIFIVDCNMDSWETPCVNMSSRGLIALEVCASVAEKDLHSGLAGGAVCNANRALLQMLDVWDEKGFVKIPEFYRDVQKLADKEKEKLLQVDDEQVMRDLCAYSKGGCEGKTLQECQGTLPTFEINGMVGGYIGDGIKTVLPAKASAKISCRLVANQDPAHIFTIVEKWLRDRAPEGVKVTINRFEGARAYRVDFNDPVSEVLLAALSEATGKKTYCSMGPASIPLIVDLAKGLNAKAYYTGVGMASDCIHAPDENFSIDQLEAGYRMITALLTKLNAAEGSFVSCEKSSRV